jgi:hypothetical protein
MKKVMGTLKCEVVRTGGRRWYVVRSFLKPGRDVCSVQVILVNPRRRISKPHPPLVPRCRDTPGHTCESVTFQRN